MRKATTNLQIEKKNKLNNGINMNLKINNDLTATFKPGNISFIHSKKWGAYIVYNLNINKKRFKVCNVKVYYISVYTLVFENK